MKKIFTLFVVCMSVLTAMAKDYTCGLAVTVMGQPIEYQQINISVDKNASGKYDILLKDFSLVMAGSPMPLGDIQLKDVDVEADEECEILHTEQIIDLMGGQMKCPTSLQGMIQGNELVIVLNIEGGFGVNVAIVSRNTQIYGADFENWHTATAGDKTSDEANGWHSFMSSTGSYASVVSGTPHLFISDDVPAASNGKHSARIISGMVFGLVSANGTITTGRMQAGGLSATDTKNCAFLDMSKTDVDGNRDPFWSPMTGHPSSITLWYKFKAGEGNANPTASVSAVITDGTYYQDPQDKEYDNIVGAAKDVLPETEGEWKQFTIPFDYATYAENNVDPASILVTISTCSVPGGGSTSTENPDEILIDDITLNYDFEPTELYIFDEKVEGFSADKTEYEIDLAKVPTSEDIDVDCKNDANAAALPYYDAATKTLILNIYSEDLKKCKTYTFKNTSTGISNVTNGSNKSVVGKYDINGMRTNGKPNQVVITKYSDGTTIKSVEK